MADEYETITIYDSRLDKLVTRIAHFNRKAARAGIEDRVDLIISKPYEITEKDRDGKDVIVKKVDITFKSPVISHKGWSLLATIEHTGAGNIIRRARTDVDIPTEIKDRQPVCDHCKTIRARHDTVLIYNDETKVIAQVGKQCLRYYLGFSAMGILWRAELIGFMAEVSEYDREPGYGRGEYAIDLVTFLAQVIAVVDKYGYTSKARAMEHEIDTTGQQAWGILIATSKAKEYWTDRERDLEKTAATDEVQGRARLLVEWLTKQVADRGTEQEYWSNLAVINRLGFVTYRTQGFAASIIAVYNRELGEVADRAVKAKSEWVGQVGDKMVFTVTALMSMTVETVYGIQYLNKFITDEGNVLVWFTGTVKFDKDDRLRLRGTIKAHNEYKGTKETALTRCKVVEEIKMAEVVNG